MEMQPYQDPDFLDLTTEQLARIDLTVSQYESLRRSGQAIAIDSLLSECDPRLRAMIERELVRAEAEILSEWGDSNALAQLSQTWPAHSDIIRNSAASNGVLDSRPAARPASSTVPGSEKSSIERAVDSPLNGDWNQRFVIRSELAKGGLGQLFVAHDLELDREVAIKVLQRQFLNRADLLSRFQAEATVTSHLEHPNIVPVYARGLRPDGQPYYAMRLIQGQAFRSLIVDTYRTAKDRTAKDRLGESMPSLNFRSDPAARDLLARLITICRAVAYAHHQGWVHRDLKPGNVMVGPFGETVIIDWGLAARIGGSDFGTVGTAGYMSPEQSKGQLDSNHPSADIYSLGCILFCILTNNQPTTESIASVGSQDGVSAPNLPRSVLRPAKQQPDLPKELDAICRKATALTTEDRYTSADALASDLEAWLADEPTTVMTETLFQRLRRNMRSHPIFSGVSLGAVIATIVAMIVLLVVTSRGNAELKAANAREQKQTQLANEAMQTAQQHAVASEKAQQRLMDLLRTFLVDVEKELSRVPGSSNVRRQVLSTALSQLSRVVNEFGDNAASVENRSQALLIIGDLFLRFGKQDLKLDIQLGDVQLKTPSEAATYYFDQAYRGIDSYLASSADIDGKLKHQLELVQCRTLQRGVEAALSKGDLEAANDLAKQSLKLAERLKEEAAANKESDQQTGEQSVIELVNWWNSVDSCGRVWRLTGDHEQLVAAMNAAVEQLGDFSNRFPEHETVARALAMANVYLGDDAFAKRDLGLAQKHYEADLQIAQKAYGNHPERIVCRRDLAISLDRMARVQQRQGDVERSIETYEQSQKLRKSLHQDDNLDQDILRDLFVSHMKLGDSHMLINHVDLAAEQYRSASELAEKMVAFDANSLPARRFQSMCAEVMADVCLARGELKEALVQAEKSLAASEEIQVLSPSSMEAADDLVIGQLKIAKVLQAMEDWSGTIDRVKLAIQQADKNAAQSGVFKSDPIFARMKLAEVLLQSGSPKDAKDTCGPLIPKIEELVAKSPEDSVWRRRHYQIYMILAEAEAKLDNNDQSRQAFQKALELAKAMIADGQRVETVQADAAEIEKQLSQL